MINEISNELLLIISLELFTSGDPVYEKVNFAVAQCELTLNHWKIKQQK